MILALLQQQLSTIRTQLLRNYVRTASKSKQAELLESFERYTTLMYRPPEMIDAFFGYPVSEKVDIWVLFDLAHSLADVWLHRLHSLLL